MARQVGFKARYLNFQGRFGCGDIWRAAGLSLIIPLPLLIAIVIIGVNDLPRSFSLQLLLILGSAVVAVPMMIVGITSTVKRLHDFNLSGWWYLVVCLASIIPHAPLLIFVVFSCIPGTVGPNGYGDDPRPEQAALATA
jgi:uncharacterized membrane protein YhaH (DUF805 family)